MFTGRSFRRSSAVEDFHKARRDAALEEILARLTGKSVELLSYDDVRQKLHASGSTPRGVRDIPLDAIVGSVGRCTDFTRSFLPRQKSDLDRWTRVRNAAPDPTELPPIDVYQIGEAYFVLDGNHRVSVARHMNMQFITARVTEVHTSVPLSAEAQPDELIVKAEAAAFLEATQLDQVCSADQLEVSVPGQYAHLENHIEVYRYFAEEAEGHDLSFEEAARRWYHEAYLPIVELIRRHDLLHDFPGRTETDLFLWLSQHRVAIRAELGLDLDPKVSVKKLVEQFNPRPEHVAARLGRRLLELVLPAQFEAGPPPGQWRTRYLAARAEGVLFADVLVSLDGEANGWRALDAALLIAQRQDARVHGVYVAPPQSDAAGESAQQVEAEFSRRCRAAGLACDLAFESGSAAREISVRSPWVDLIVLSLCCPPGTQAAERLGSDLRTILYNCARPVLVVPGAMPKLERALLAYDGGPKAEEALFVAAYLAERWGVALTVLTVEGEGVRSQVSGRAQAYLRTRGVEAQRLQRRGPVAGEILLTAEELQTDLILMGSYGPHPLVEVARDSLVNDVLRSSRWPVMVCR